MDMHRCKSLQPDARSAPTARSDHSQLRDYRDTHLFPFYLTPGRSTPWWPASVGERSPRRATGRRKIVTQAFENRPSRPKMAPPSVGSAVASAATRCAAPRPTRREANHAARASAPANGGPPRPSAPFRHAANNDRTGSLADRPRLGVARQTFAPTARARRSGSSAARANRPAW